MNNILKKQRILIIMLVIILTIPFQVLAQNDLKPIEVLDFSDVEPLMMSRYQLILDNVHAYSNANSGLDDIQTGTDNIYDLLVSLNNISTTDPAVQSLISVVAGLLNSQFQIAMGQNSMANRTSITDIGLQTEQANNSIVWNMECMYITYNSLNQQLEDMLSKKSLLDNQQLAVKLQKDLGIVSEITVLNVDSQIEELEIGIQQLEEARKAIIHTFNVNLSQDYDTDMDIQEVPSVIPKQIETINVDRDYQEAVKNSYSIRLNRHDKDKEDNAERTFKKDYYKVYQDLLDKQKALELETIKLNIAQKRLNTASLKYKLGMLSTNQYQAEYCDYVSDKIALQGAKDSLFKAYRAYEWAKKGLITSSALAG